MSGSVSPVSGGAGRAARVTQRHGTIIVVGGGCYGAYYVRQLLRAARSDALTWERLVVVDRDPACQVARSGAPLDAPGSSPAAEIVVAEWRAYFERAIPEGRANDAIVPSPLMPHLMVEWLIDRVRERFPDREVGLKALDAELPVPWQLANGDAPHYASFATWTCPVNCIEPATCPHTRTARDWSMPVAMRAYVESRVAAGRPLGVRCCSTANTVPLASACLTWRRCARPERSCWRRRSRGRPSSSWGRFPIATARWRDSSSARRHGSAVPRSRDARLSRSRRALAPPLPRPC